MVMRRQELRISLILPDISQIILSPLPLNPMIINNVGDGGKDIGMSP